MSTVRAKMVFQPPHRERKDRRFSGCSKRGVRGERDEINDWPPIISLSGSESWKTAETAPLHIVCRGCLSVWGRTPVNGCKSGTFVGETFAFDPLVMFVWWLLCIMDRVDGFLVCWSWCIGVWKNMVGWKNVALERVYWQWFGIYSVGKTREQCILILNHDFALGDNDSIVMFVDCDSCVF